MPAELALVAVGGYGRGELHPCSDVDLLVLLPKSETVPRPQAGTRALPDLALGHRPRDPPQRAHASTTASARARHDLTVATTLMEARLLVGPRRPVRRHARARSRRTRSGRRATSSRPRCAEQQARHHRYDDTAYNLEPNVKGSPGGLRDIQTIGWVAKRHFGAETLDDLVAHGFLTAPELRKLRQAQAFLWQMRFALHMLTGRREDRLLFDHQIRIAEAVRLPGRDLHARRRAVHAALLPHGHGPQPAQRNAAAAVPGGDPERGRERDRAAQRALPAAQRLPRGHGTTIPSTATPSAIARAVPDAAAAPGRARACAPRPSG